MRVFQISSGDDGVPASVSASAQGFRVTMDLLTRLSNAGNARAKQAK